MRGFRHIFDTLIASALRQQYEAFERLFQRRPALGIVNVFGFGGLIAREKLGVPIVTLHVQPAVILEPHRAAVPAWHSRPALDSESAVPARREI